MRHLIAFLVSLMFFFGQVVYADQPPAGLPKIYPSFYWTQATPVESYYTVITVVGSGNSLKPGGSFDGYLLEWQNNLGGVSTAFLKSALFTNVDSQGKSTPINGVYFFVPKAFNYNITITPVFLVNGGKGLMYLHSPTAYRGGTQFIGLGVGFQMPSVNSAVWSPQAAVKPAGAYALCSADSVEGTAGQYATVHTRKVSANTLCSGVEVSFTSETGIPQQVYPPLQGVAVGPGWTQWSKLGETAIPSNFKPGNEVTARAFYVDGDKRVIYSPTPIAAPIR